MKRIRWPVLVLIPSWSIPDRRPSPPKSHAAAAIQREDFNADVLPASRDSSRLCTTSVWPWVTVIDCVTVRSWLQCYSRCAAATATANRIWYRGRCHCYSHDTATWVFCLTVRATVVELHHFGRVLRGTFWNGWSATFYGLVFLSVAEPTASKNWSKIAAIRIQHRIYVLTRHWQLYSTAAIVEQVEIILFAMSDTEQSVPTVLTFPCFNTIG